MSVLFYEFKHTYPVSKFQCFKARRLDRESENITHLLCFERRIMRSERSRATSSAINMLAWFAIAIRKLDMTPTAAAATVSLALDPPCITVLCGYSHVGFYRVD